MVSKDVPDKDLNFGRLGCCASVIAARNARSNSNDVCHAGSYDTTVRFWALSTLRCVRKCEGHDDAVRVLAVAGGKVFSGSYDGTIGVW